MNEKSYNITWVNMLRKKRSYKNDKYLVECFTFAGYTFRTNGFESFMVYYFESFNALFLGLFDDKRIEQYR